MTHEEILKKVDHTLLAQTATREEILALCGDALRYRAASVCIPPCYVRDACSCLKGRVKIATVVGFPNGNTTTEAKLFEAEEAILNGADEIDMVINVGALKAGDFEGVEEEIRALKEAVGGRILKVIIETCFLTEKEKIKMCEIVTRAGADYIKTSTGFAGGGATFEDVKLLAEHVGAGVGVKASGGISSFEDAERFIRLGASRLGTSRLVKIEKAISS